jgi:enoyl-CoA hydratase
MTDATTVRLEVRDQVATVWLNRPESRNALNSLLVAELPVVVSEASRRDDVRAVVVTGADPAFCAGLDLRELGSTGANLGLPRGANFGWPWDSAGKPVIGAVNGAAVAGGFELALACDLLVASERATFADTHARIGQVPGAGLTVRLSRLVGPGRARELSYTGNFITAATAESWGLVNHVVPHDDLLEVAHRLARDIASNDPDAVKALGELYRATENLPPREALAYEALFAREWQSEHCDPAVVEGRRADVLHRSRAQRGDSGKGGPA